MMNEFYLKDYLDLLLNKKKVIISGTILCMIVATLVSLFLPNIYQARAIVYVFVPEVKTEFAPQEVSLDLNHGAWDKVAAYNFRGGIEESSLSINAFSELAESPEIFQQLINKLGLKGITIEDLDRKILKVKLLEVHGSLSLRTYAPIIRLIAETKDKKLSHVLANAWAEILVEKINKISNYRFEEASKFVAEELTISKSNLMSAEKAWMDLKKMANIAVLEMELKASQDDFLAFNSELNKIRVSSQPKNAQGQEMGALKAREAYLLDLLDKTKNEISRLQVEIDEKKQQLSQLQREVDANKMEYDLLGQKKEQFKISNVERPFKAKVIASSAQPQKHIRPMRALTVSTAGLLGFMLMCLLVLLRRY